MPGSPGIGFTLSGAPPTSYTPPYQAQAPVYPTPMQAPGPIGPSLSTTGDYGFRRTSEPPAFPQNMGNGFTNDDSNQQTCTFQPKKSKHK